MVDGSSFAIFYYIITRYTRTTDVKNDCGLIYPILTPFMLKSNQNNINIINKHIIL